MNDSMNLKEILELFVRKWKSVVTFVLLITLCGGLGSFAIPPTYEAKVDLLINSPLKEEGRAVLEAYEIDMNLRLIETYRYILKSDRMLSKVNLVLNKRYKKFELTKKIKVESSSESQIITIIAQEVSPQKAALLVNTYATTFQGEIKELMNLENINVLKASSADRDTKKVKPSIIVYFIMSFVLSLLISLMTIIAKEVYLTPLDTVRKVENALGISNLGTIPLINGRYKNRKYRHRAEEGIFTNLDFPDLVIEEYRSLSGNLEFIMKTKNLKTFMVTSASEGDGKSTTSGNLAIIMAMNGKKTLYIDADLRKSSGRVLFNLPKRKGLTSNLAGYYPLDKIIQETEVDNLSFISAGPIPQNPTKLLASNQLKQLLDELKKTFDLIIIDTPPIVVSDAVTLSSIVDGCLFVIDAMSTKEDIAVKSLAKLTKVNAPIVGSILNRTRFTKSKVYYY